MGWVRTALRRRLDAKAASRLAAADGEREEIVKALPGLEDDERDVVAAALREADERMAAIDARSDLVFPAVLVVVAPPLLIAMIASTLKEPTSLSAAGVLLGIGIAAIPWQVRFFASWRAYGPTPSPSSAAPIVKRLRGISLTMAVTAAPTTVMLPLGLAGIISERAIGYRTGISAVAALATMFGVLLTLVAAARLATRHQVSQPFDQVLPRLAGLIEEMERLAPVWNRPDASRYFVHCLERLARITKERLPWAGRAPLSDPSIRRRLHQSNDDLARIIRAHKRAVASARTRADYDKAIESLTSGVLAIAANDWDALFAHSPDGPRRHWWSSYAAANLFPAAVLSIAALVLPWVPPFLHHKPPAGSIRVTLVAFAILRLIPGPSVTDLIDKGLSRGFDAAKRG